MALDGPEQVWRLQRPGGDGGSMRSRRDLRWPAGWGSRVGWVEWVGGGWANPDWAVPRTGSAVSAPPPAGQSRAGRRGPCGSGGSEGNDGNGNRLVRESQDVRPRSSRWLHL